MAAPALDVEKFRKVDALIERGATKGERQAAFGRATEMAKAAGLNLKTARAAAAAAGEPTPPTPPPPTSASTAADAFNAFFNTPEMRAERAEREVKRQARCRELLAEYGSEEAIFAETDREAALRAACEPFIVWDQRPDWKGSYEITGWDSLGAKRDMPDVFREAVSRAWPMPTSVAEAWTEFSAADNLDDDRSTMDDGRYEPHRWVEARRYVLEHLLDTMPARDLVDMLGRQSWLEHLNSQGFSRDIHEDTKLIATMRADLERAIATSVGRSA